MQESLISATESHHSPLSLQWHNAHEEYFPLIDVGPETSHPCEFIGLLPGRVFLPADIKPADSEAFDLNELRLI